MYTPARRERGSPLDLYLPLKSLPDSRYAKGRRARAQSRYSTISKEVARVCCQRLSIHGQPRGAYSQNGRQPISTSGTHMQLQFSHWDSIPVVELSRQDHVKIAEVRIAEYAGRCNLSLQRAQVDRSGRRTGRRGGRPVEPPSANFAIPSLASAFASAP